MILQQNTGLRVFRRRYPQGDNLVVSSDIDRPHEKNVGGFKIRFTGISNLKTELPA